MDKSSELPPAYSQVPQGQGYSQPPFPGGQNPPPGPPQYAPQQWGQYQGHQYPPPGQYPAQPGQPGQPGYYQYGNVVVQQPLGHQVTTGPPPNDYMCSAIFVTLFCFWPTGIVAIMKASESRTALARGDMAAANSYANSARSMVRISVGIGIISLIVVAVLLGVYFAIIFKNIHDYDD